MNYILLMYSTHEVTEQHCKNLKKIAPNFVIKIAKSELEAIEYAAETEIIFGHRYLRQVLPVASKLRWVQTTAGGVDQLPLTILKERQILLSNSHLSAEAIARHAHSLFIALVNNIKGWQDSAKRKKAMILGFGHVGQKLAIKLKASDLIVYGVKRKNSQNLHKLCDELITDKSWQDKLKEIDVCFLTLSLNKQTTNFLNTKLLKKLQKNALIINVGRGDTVNEKTLITMLKNRKLAGVAVDVLGKYLSKINLNDLMKQKINFIFTPHIAANYPRRAADIEDFFESQLKKYLNNQKIDNLIKYDEY